MKRIVLVISIALLAGCGNTKNEGTDASEAAAAAGSTIAGGSDDTITVENFGDMPAQCIDLLVAFLKKVEPTVAKVDWEKATLAEFEAFGEQFQAESDSFDTQTAAAGCDKYNLSGSDEAQFQQMMELAKVQAPGTIGFLTFLSALATDVTANVGSIPTDCAETIAAIEPYLGDGKSLKDLTIAQVTTVGQLMSGVSTNCSADESTAFYARDDVRSFIGN